ncbi:HlyD family efflux transporter periplasmic adaptor subunit [Pseudobutyrivibrio sp. MD2005]|uniref:HlyD family efflux transporter periplasmic adaptor subunit n=1 Tax=Pseudobutyrivibrio sp. MD2005 TaxID=1410616 RepID=UPI000484E5DC|nr:HlyD family efflux transporter periplasmic adaptor subunit [Pseudobutyrivibrio sp. MD2005]
MKKAKKNDKIIKYPKQYHFSIGFIIIGVMFIYMIYHLFTYITADNITVYEVSQGSISSNLEYNALAIREEQVITAENSGDVLYLSENFGKVGSKTQIYALDTTGEILSSIKESTEKSEITLDEESYDKIQSLVTNYVLDYEPSEFNKTYAFKNELESQVEQLYTVSAMEAMGDSLNQAVANGSFNIYNSPVPGLVVYSIDGLEDLTIDNFMSDSLDISNYSSVNLKAQESVVAGQAVYKVITSDHWNLVFEVDKTLYDSLQGETYLKIKFLEDEAETWTNLDFAEKAGKYYLILTLDDSMDRYADSRFVHIKIINNNISGLKIPNSSIVLKDFYTIPKGYMIQGNNTDDAGFLLQSGNENVFVTPTIYYENDDFYFVDDEILTRGDKLVKPNSNETYVVGSDMDSLEGVYNVNKGYAVFKQIEVLYQNDDYSIIKTGTNYGISMYDHIVLQGNEVEENTIIN